MSWGSARHFRTASAIFLLLLPVFHSIIHELHSPRPRSCTQSAATSTAESQAQIDDDTDCPICAFRIGESFLLEKQVCLETQTNLHGSLPQIRVSAVSRAGLVSANPRAPPALLG
jgi:hypothetical protein